MTLLCFKYTFKQSSQLKIYIVLLKTIFRIAKNLNPPSKYYTNWEEILRGRVIITNVFKNINYLMES